MEFIANKFDNDVDSFFEVVINDFNPFIVNVRSIITHGLENSWQLFSINIPSHRRSIGKNSTVKISLYTKKSTKIAIDDIYVHDRACPRLGDCDFEYGKFQQNSVHFVDFCNDFFLIFRLLWMDTNNP